MNRVKTGIPGLDFMLGGGVLPGSIILVSGTPGSGKSTLALQFLLEGMRIGENGGYISLEEEKCCFFRNMRSFGWDLPGFEEQQKLYFESYRTEELLKEIRDGYQTIDNELRRRRVKRMVIDSITAYLLACEDELTRRNELRRLFENIRKWKVAAILTGESHHADSGYGVDYMVDAIIRLQCKRGGAHGRVERCIEVEKMRGSRHSLETFRMEMSSGGIAVTDFYEVQGRGYRHEVSSLACRLNEQPLTDS